MDRETVIIREEVNRPKPAVSLEGQQVQSILSEGRHPIMIEGGKQCILWSEHQSVRVEIILTNSPHNPIHIHNSL